MNLCIYYLSFSSVSSILNVRYLPLPKTLAASLLRATLTELHSPFAAWRKGKHKIVVNPSLPDPKAIFRDLFRGGETTFLITGLFPGRMVAEQDQHPWRSKGSDGLREMPRGVQLMRSMDMECVPM